MYWCHFLMFLVLEVKSFLFCRLIFSSTIYSKTFLFPASSSGFQYMHSRPLKSFHSSLIFHLFLKFFFLFMFHFGKFLLVCLQFNNIFFYIPNLPLIPSSVFFLLDIAIFISKSLVWVFFMSSLSLLSF